MKKLKDKNLYLSLLIVLIFFGIFIKMDFATDTYCDLASAPRQIFDHFMLSGRFVTAFLWGIVNVLNFSDYLIYLCSYILAIVSVTLSIYNVFLVINKKIKKDTVSLIISTITIINPFSIELFMFLEKGILTFAVLLSVLAFSEFVKYLEGNKKALKYIFLLMLIATFCYQGVIGIFIVLSAVYVILYNKNIKDFIKNNIIILLAYGVPAIINLLIVKFMYGNSRVTGEIILDESIKKILDGSLQMLGTFTILPKYTLIIAISILSILAIVMIFINKKDSIKKKILKLLGLIYITIAILGISIAPQLLQDTASIGFSSRATYPFASIIGIFSMYILLNTQDIKLINKINGIYLSSLVISIISVAILIIQFAEFNDIETDRYTLNYLDEINSKEIGRKIQEYENETGNTVTKICIYTDKYISYTYKGLRNIGDMNVTGFAPDWSLKDMINYYNDLSLIQVNEKNSEIEQKFAEQNWDNYNEDQIIFVGDTIHYCKF